MVARNRGTPPPFFAGVGIRRGPTFYVAAHSLHRLPAAADGVARGARVLVVPGALPGRTASFEVAGCSGYELHGRQGAPKSAAARAAAIAGARAG
jgi:hypothetical protein